MHKDITEIFCFIDNSAKLYEQDKKKRLLPSNRKRYRETNMSLGELLTIMVIFRTSYAKNFKYFYKGYIEHFYSQDFPNAMNYNRFVELISRLFIPFNTLLHLFYCMVKKPVYILLIQLPLKLVIISEGIRTRYLPGLAKSSKSSMGFFMVLSYTQLSTIRES